MKKLLFVLLLIMLLVFTGCNNGHYNYEEDVPELKISSDNGEITVEKGTYEWTVKEGYFSDKTTIKDTDSPEKIAEKMGANRVLPRTKLNLLFSKEPDNIEVIPWGELKSDDYNLTGKEMIVPDKEGIYIFEILSEWKQGKASYIIKIAVESSDF